MRGLRGDTDERPEYDDVYRYVATFGRYQKAVILLVSFLAALIAYQFSILLFGFGTPNVHCTTANVSCPVSKCCDNCTEYQFDGPFNSVVSEWRLICDQSYKRAVVQSCYYAGMLVGSFVSGIASDKYGRRFCILIFTATMILSASLSVVVDCVSFLAFLRFLVGCGTSGMYTGTFALSLELIGPKRRTMYGSVYQWYWALGFLSFALAAYFIRDWRPLVLVTSLPGLLLFLFIRVLPESPRWLLTQGRLEEALTVLVKYRTQDRRTVNREELKTLLHDIRQEQLASFKDKEDRKYTVMDLLRSPRMRRRSLIMGYSWFAVSFLGNAFFLYVDNLVGNIYLNFTIIQALNPVGIAITWVLMKRFGRRVVHAGNFLVAGSLCLLSLAVPDDQPLVRTWIFVSGAVITANLWVTSPLIGSELFPTVLRATALGAGYTIGRAGAILAPYVGMMAQLPGSNITLPLTIFGAVAISSGIFSLWLPETMYSTMHQTIEEEEAAPEDYGFPCCRKRATADHTYGGTIADEPLAIENHSNTTAL